MPGPYSNPPGRNVFGQAASGGAGGAGAVSQTGQAVRLSPLPSGAAIAAVTTAEEREEHYTIQATNTIESAFGHLDIISGRVYVYSTVTAGVLADAAGACYLGRSPKFLTEVRAVGDQNVPYLINETANGELQPARIYVNGTAGDKILLMYRPR